MGGVMLIGCALIAFVIFNSTLHRLAVAAVDGRLRRRSASPTTT